MATTIPTKDSFGWGTWKQKRPLEYLRGSYLDATFAATDPRLVQRSGDTYISAETGGVTAFLYRRQSTSSEQTAKIRVRLNRVSGSGGNGSVGVMLAADPDTYVESASANYSDYFQGLATAFSAEWQMDGTITLYRHTGPTSQTSVATSSATMTEDTFYTLEIVAAVNNQATTSIQVKVNGDTKINSNPLNGSTTYGHAGFVLDESSSGVAYFQIDYFRHVDDDTGDVLVEDDFQRPDWTLITYGGEKQAALMWEWGDLAQTTGTGTTRAPGFHRGRWVFDGGTAAGSGQQVDLYQRTPDGADQDTIIKVRFDSYVENPEHLMGVVCRGDKATQGSGLGSLTGYVGVITPGSFLGTAGLAILRFNTGSATTLASVPFQVQADLDYNLRLNATTDAGDVDLTLYVDGVALVEYTDDSGSKITDTNYQGIYWKWACVGTSCANSGNFALDFFKATASIPAPGFSGEKATAATLTVRADWPQDDPPVYERFDWKHEGGYSQTAARFLRARRPLSLKWRHLSDTDKDTVLDFLDERVKRAETFRVTLYDGSTTRDLHLAGAEIPYELVDVDIWNIGPVRCYERLDITDTP